MNRKTVENYTEDEFESAGFSGAIRNKKKRSSFLLILILSVAAAIALWLFVLAENNTCSGISVLVTGNEQLMSHNYTVSAISPSTIDVVLRGKGDMITQIKQNQSLISATVKVFGSKDDPEGSYLFDDPEKIEPGEYTVDVTFSLPDGVSCGTKSVKVTVSESYSKDFFQDSFRVNLTNYSFGNGYSMAEQYVKEETLTVSGEESTVTKIGYIGLNVDWLSEVTGDVAASVEPVAYDVFGGQIDSTFLHFEPETLTVGVSVNKSATFRLSLKTPENDSGIYTLSQNSIRLIGPAALIEGMEEEIVLNESQDFATDPNVLSTYTFDASLFGFGVRVEDPSGISKTVQIGVSRAEGQRYATITVPYADWIVLLPDNAAVSAGSEELQFGIRYTSHNGAVLTKDSFKVIFDLRACTPGNAVITPVITRTITDGVQDLTVGEIPAVAFTLTAEAPEEPTPSEV